MIRFEQMEVHGWEPAIRGMRNPMNSWDKSDSRICGELDCTECGFYYEEGRIECQKRVESDLILGENDLSLMKRLAQAGTDHRKFLRMIIVYVDITAPLYWWKEFDTYKVGTVANSCSTMHKIHDKEITLEDFSHERMTDAALGVLNDTIGEMNFLRRWFLDTKDKYFFDSMIQLLPSSYNQKRTIMMNYEVLCNIYKSRKNHKLDEWREMCMWIESLPYSQLITGKDDGA